MPTHCPETYALHSIWITITMIAITCPITVFRYNEWVSVINLILQEQNIDKFIQKLKSSSPITFPFSEMQPNATR